MDILRANLSKIRTPSPEDRIFKDECVFSFDTPESEHGLFICMKTFLGFSQHYVKMYHNETGCSIFLNLKRTKKEIPEDPKAVEQQKPTRLAIGLEGGFSVDDVKRYEYEEFNSIVLLPDFIEIPLPSPDLPDQIQLAIASVLSAESASKVEEAQALIGTWDGEKRKVSKHAENLLQLENGARISPKGWKCDRCDLSENLWLNLTDGAILCGRKFFDGSGGNNHAMEHFTETRYPLVVKLGTITPNGADVYSYDEDDMVEDPLLSKHLGHFGINISQMEKTDKSMVELEIDMNQRIGEWALLQEADSQLVPVYGPGYTGLSNLGNSCYLNSVMQVVFTIPDFQKRYYDIAENIFLSSSNHPADDFNVQLAKLASGLLSGRYSEQPKDAAQAKDANESQPGIKPTMFKNLVGKGHPEFSTKRQQDAQEFFLHLINMLERHNRGNNNPAECFKFEVEERIQCVESKKVKYTTRTDYLLSLPIPMDKAVNMDEVNAFNVMKATKDSLGEKIDQSVTVRPRITMKACLDCYVGPETVDDFFSSALNRKSKAEKKTQLRSFPDYLMVQFKKFTLGDDWVPKKLDVAIDIPDNLDISFMRGSGIQPGEEKLPETKVATDIQVQFDEEVISQLMDMGFPLDGCKRALFATKNTGVEPAMNWIMEHMGDPDFGDPFVCPGQEQKTHFSDFVPNEEAVGMIIAMGFTNEQAIKALKNTDNNVERAIDWIFSHGDELDTVEPVPMETEVTPQSKYRDGSGKYQLVSIISHMGTSTFVGHYVCHIFKDNRWVIFNDNKVALSEHPPKEYGYLYLYRRV